MADTDLPDTASNEVHPDVPTDDDGAPVHPEAGHSICGARKSHTATPAPHGRSRDDIEYCLQAAGKGTDHLGSGRCGLHGGASSGAPTGPDNGNYDHGAFSEVIGDTISDAEKRMMAEFREATQDPHSDEARGVIQQAAALAFIRFIRSGNPKFLAEYRQLCAEFNLVDATQHVAHGDSESWYDRLEAAESAVDGDDDDDDNEPITIPSSEEL